jgi:hypothetical protein
MDLHLAWLGNNNFFLIVENFEKCLPTIPKI